MSDVVPEKATRLVVVEYDPPTKYLSESLGVLAPNARGEQTLFVHTHLAQHGPLPYIRRVKDFETGELIRVSGSWLGGNQRAALAREDRCGDELDQLTCRRPLMQRIRRACKELRGG